MDSTWFLVGFSVLVSGSFVAGWVLGGRNRENKIKMQGLKDINRHYEKMADDFNRVDRTIDRVHNRLGRVLNLPSKGSKVPKTK